MKKVNKRNIFIGVLCLLAFGMMVAFVLISVYMDREWEKNASAEAKENASRLEKELATVTCGDLIVFPAGSIFMVHRVDKERSSVDFMKSPSGLTDIPQPITQMAKKGVKIVKKNKYGTRTEWENAELLRMFCINAQ